MHALVGVIVLLLPAILFGLNTEGDVYLLGSSKQDIELVKENKAIIGGNFTLMDDRYFLDAQAQYTVPFDTTKSENNLSFLGEIFFPWGGLSAGVYCQNGNTIYRDYVKAGGEIFRTIENIRSIVEFGNILEYSTYKEFKDFDHIDNSTYLLYKKFFKQYAFHTYFDFKYRRFNNYSKHSIDLTKISAEIYFSRPIKRNVGVKYGFYVNKNITSCDSLLYVSTDLYDSFSYDLITLFIESTVYFKNLLLKPEASFEHKKYRSIAETDAHTENGIRVSLYADYPIIEELYLYSSSYVHMLIDQSSGNNFYGVSIGLKYTYIQ